jgi:hypothetical protein
MSCSVPVTRSLAQALMSGATALLPGSRAHWGAAMRAEMQHIGADREALWWAVGCLHSACVERLRSRPLLELRWIRFGLALWAIYRIADQLCDTCLVLSYKLPRLGLTRFLGHCAQGPDYQQLIPLFKVTSGWELMVCVAGCALYMAAIVSLWARRRYALGCFVAAAALSVMLWLYELTKPLYVQAFSFADIVREGLLYALTASFGLALWQSARARNLAAP